MTDLVETFVAAAQVAGFTVHRGVLPDLPGAAVSHALYGLADSGSVVLAAAFDEPRATSLLSDVHVSRVRASRILPGLAELFIEMGGQLPSSLAIVTGPSRTTDIEQTLAIGVHGPGEVHILLEEDRVDA